ncbi:phosphoribosyltransferase-like protein [Sphingobium indicum]|uniref:phosphoribosyltransferase-like protein n=1 Tax=Sphingobium indicum TaxID=332055 RepID=UPI0005622D00|nr:hypothetical protein [Sphingobium indicum]
MPVRKSPRHDPITDELQSKIKTLHSSIWERRADWPEVLDWLNQFEEHDDPDADEQLQALRLLSSFMYFGVNEMRALLRSLFRDTFRPQVAKEVRAGLHPSTTLSIVGSMVDVELRHTRFVSLGNPSESSALLLYYFRQENLLPKNLFLHGSDIFDLSDIGSDVGLKVQDTSITRYVFIDDLCGSGHQGREYSDRIVKPLKSIKPDVKTYYYPIFGLSDGIQYLRTHSTFDEVYPVVELDPTFRAFATDSRLYVEPEIAPLRLPTEATCRRYGSQLVPAHPLGWEDGQLYIGFAHNTPDNSLPIFWCDHTSPKPWRPIFRRYPKVSW